MHITYLITGQAQNRINRLMIKYSPKYTFIIWTASLSCLFLPLLVFRNSLSTILLSSLFGSAFVAFWILNLGLKYAVHKRFGRHYQPNLELETRTLSLGADGITITSSLLKPAFRPYRKVGMITVEDNIIVIAGKDGWLELSPRDQVSEGNCGYLLDELCRRTGKKLKNPG